MFAQNFITQSAAVHK